MADPSPAPPDVLRPHAEAQYAHELTALAAADARERPPGWRLSPWAVVDYLLGGQLPDGTVVTPKTCGTFTKFSWIDPGPGATIIVPPLVPKKSIWADIELVTRVIYQLAVTAGVVVTVLK